jgi:predicted RNase H-like nuclease (RuvC/YqgF family)
MSKQEPKAHVIDGVTYVEAHREARYGDKVLIVNEEETYGRYRNGDVITVQRIVHSGIENDSARSAEYEGNNTGFISKREYVVLERIKKTLSELISKCASENRHEEVNFDSPQVTDILANLARRVSSLEQQLSSTQSNVEKLAEELENAKHRVSKHAERVGMLTDDIITLDERSQVLNAINKFYEEGSR